MPAQVAYVLESDGTIALCDNYRELLAEAERQFPGAELSDEKLIMYNIE